MLVIKGSTLDLLRESLDCLYTSDLVTEVSAVKRSNYYDVRFTLYNMADNDRFFYASARIDLDGCIKWDRIEQFPVCD